MLDFLNPGYLAAAAALVSAPIIIHLINRMRFKRVHWAAMEFLLKAQKRMRKRLIIEQLLLLALRCLLVAMVGLLVLRFVGFSGGSERSNRALHIVLLDDTPSMLDEWKEGEVVKNAFTVAKKEVLLGKIVKALELTASSDRLMLIPLSRLVTDKDYQPKTYEKLNDGTRLKEFTEDLEGLECSKIHVDVLQGIKKVRDIVNNNENTEITIHVLGDFRQGDWDLSKVDPSAKGRPKEGAKDAEENLSSILVQMTQARKEVKVRLVDTVGHPYRKGDEAVAPISHENVAIVDLRAGTRIVGKDMPVPFTVTLANYSAREVEVNVVIYDDSRGDERQDIDFNPPMPIKIPAGSVDTKAVFEMRFSPTFKPGEPFFAAISARLEGPQRSKLADDHLAIDNVRHATVEVREKVPVLVIDGEGQRGRLEDSFFIHMAVLSVPGASYEVVYGDEIGGGTATKALERPDLRQYPSIFLLNVRDLTDKQRLNLENYVKEGGGVVFFMGPQVNPTFYNQKLYQQGKGVFPVPLKENFFPAATEEPLKVEYTGLPQLHIRKDKFGSMDAVPIFGQVFKGEAQANPFKDLPIKRYFQVPRADWRNSGTAHELATLPNRQPITQFQRAALDVVRGKALEEIFKNEEFAKYRQGIDRHRLVVERLVGPTSELEAAHLSKALEDMLTDKGVEKNEARPNLTEFWSNSDPKIASLREDVVRLADQAKFGDPFIIASEYGKGRVVAVMTTSGKEWNDWGGGSDATLLYQPFIWELQNYLSSQGGESNLMVGSEVQVVVDSEPYKQQKAGARLKLTRMFYKPEFGKPAKLIKQNEQFGTEGTGKEKNLVYFTLGRNDEPGLYVGLLKLDDGTERSPVVASFAHNFNVDSLKESSLARVSTKDIQDKILTPAPKGAIQFEGPEIRPDSLVPRKSDLSESPLLYLMFILILIAEQALAVHLSFHLKGSESDALGRAATVQKQAA